MFDIGWTEMLVVAVVAIIVVGPKDLPGMLRTVGKSIKKIRGMAGDFQRQFDDALKEAELDGVKKSIDDVRSMNPLNKMKDSLNPLKDLESELKDDLKDIQFNDDDGEDDPGQVDDEDYTSFDPGDLFDESKIIKVAEPVKVDVNAALAKEKAKTKKAAKSSAAKAKKPASKATKPVAKTTKAAAKKPAPKSVAKKPAAKSVTKKPAVKSTTKKPAAKKPVAKTANKTANKAAASPRKSAPKKAKSA